MKTFYKYVINLVWFIIVAALVFAFFTVNEIDNPGLIWPYSKVKALELKECLAKNLDIKDTPINCSLSFKVGEYAKTPEQKAQFKATYGIDLDRHSNGDIGANWKATFGEMTKKSEEDTKKNNQTGEIKVEGSLGKLKPTQEGKDSIMNKLNSLNVVDSYDNVDYKRSQWPHWKSIKGCWNSRDEALKEQAESFKYLDKNKNETSNSENACSVEGTWQDPYSDEKIEKVTKADLDHTVPLKAAARAGGQNWSREEKQNFANDVDHLVVTSATQNRSKGAKTPSEWMPPKDEAKCNYAKIYTYTLEKYKLNITQVDKDVLANAISSCPA